MSTDTAGTPLRSVVICLALQGGAYPRYALPQNAGNPSATPGCTFLDSFSLQRSK